MKNPGNFLIFSYVILIAGLLLSFFLLNTTMAAPNYLGIFVLGLGAIIVPLLLSLLLAIFFGKKRFVIILAWINTFTGLSAFVLVWYIIGMIFIT